MRPITLKSNSAVQPALIGCGTTHVLMHTQREYSEILISGSLHKWIRRLTGSKVWEPKPCFSFLTHMDKWIRWLNGSKFEFPK